jgi:hypothetical protein
LSEDKDTHSSSGETVTYVRRTRKILGTVLFMKAHNLPSSLLTSAFFSTMKFTAAAFVATLGPVAAFQSSS